MLNIDEIRSGYGETEVIHGVDLEVKEGEVVSIVGPNGSGKSTFLKTIVGLVSCWDGTIKYKYNDISNIQPHKIVYEGICYVPQRQDVFPGLTVRENLRMGAWALQEGLEENMAKIFDIFPMLEEFQNRQAEYLSGGQRRMLGIGSALMINPELIILDEPSAGLAPDLVDDMFNKLKEINDAGTTILICEQNARRALKESDRGLVLVMGEKRLEASGHEILDSPEIGELYLGSTQE